MSRILGTVTVHAIELSSVSLETITLAVSRWLVYEPLLKTKQVRFFSKLTDGKDHVSSMYIRFYDVFIELGTFRTPTGWCEGVLRDLQLCLRTIKGVELDFTQLSTEGRSTACAGQIPEA